MREIYPASPAANRELMHHVAVHWLLFYDVVDDYVERRMPFPPDHLAHAKAAAHARGELMLAGALAEPPDGAVLVFRGDSPDVARAFRA